MSLDEDWKALLASKHDSTMVAPILILADASLILQDGMLDGDQAEDFIAMLPHVIPIIREYWQSPKNGFVAKSSPPSLTRQPTIASRSN